MKYRLVLIFIFGILFSGYSQEYEDSIPRKFLLFYHQYAITTSYADFARYQKLTAKHLPSISPSFGIGLKRENLNYVFSFNSTWGMHKNNMYFFYKNIRLEDIYSIWHWQYKRCILLGFKMSKRETLSLFVSNSINVLVSLENWDRNIRFLRTERDSKNIMINSNDVFFDNGLGIDYEIKLREDEKMKLYYRVEASLKQRSLNIQTNTAIGINQPYSLTYNVIDVTFGLRF